MPKKILFIFSFLCCTSLYSQKVTYNHILDSTDSTTREIQRIFEAYLKSEPQKQQPNKFWNAEVQQNFEQFDFLEDEFNPSLYMGFPAHVLSIKSNGDLHQVKVQYSYCQEDGNPYVLAIVNYYLKPVNGELRLFNALSINRKKWNMEKLGLIDYYFPKDHEFNRNKASNANDFIDKITEIFEVPPSSFEYYLADDYDEIQELKGLDYYIGMGGKNIPSGKASANRIFGAGLGEDYLHEIVHVQIDKHFPNKHYWVTEGLATFLSGESRGKPIEWHQKRIHEYLKENPTVNLNNLTDFVTYDAYTDYHYALGSFLMSRLYQKGGWDLIKKALKSGKSEDDFYSFLEQELGVPKSQLNTYIRGELEKKFNT